MVPPHASLQLGLPGPRRSTADRDATRSRGAAWRTSFPLLCGILVLAVASTGRAQPGNPGFNPFGEPAGNSYIALPNPPRELRQAMVNAAKSIQEGEFTEAVELLAEILNREETEDYLIQDRGPDEPPTSLKMTAMQMIGALPAAGRENYELQFGRDARRELEAGIAARDLDKIMSVSRRFYHTEAGYEATMLLARFELDRGRPAAAALHLRRLAENAAALTRYDPELTLLLATCWQLADERDRARETLVAWKRRAPQTRVTVGGREIQLFQRDDQALAWLDQVIGERRASQTTRLDQWTMFRGGPDRDEVTSGGAPLPSVRWSQRTTEPAMDGDYESSDEKIVQNFYQQAMNNGEPLLPVTQPLAVNGTVIMRTPQHLFGVDMRTGKLIWPYPWFEPEANVFDAADSAVVAGNPRIPARAQGLRQRVWFDAMHGQVASDGELVFFLYGTSTVMPQMAAQNPLFMRGQVMRGQELQGPVNQLIAVELETEGKTRWIVGGSDGDEPQLADAFFLGAPLPLGRQLYAIAELKDEIKLVVLDAATGKLEWSQQLAHVEVPYAILMDPNRRFAGATPSYADGVLVCPTSTGAVIAVDVATRTLLWAHEYRTTNRRTTTNRRFILNMAAGNTEYGRTWSDATAKISQGRVLLTPVESDQLHCLDLFTGRSSWEKPVPREDSLYLAAVHHDEVVLVGKESVRSIHLSDGRPSWKVDVPNRAMPSGIGFRTAEAYFLPTTDKQLVQLDLNDGTIVATHQMDQQLGNVICYQDQVISLGHDWVHVFYQRDRLREVVHRRLQENPNDAEMLEHQARLLLEDGKPAEALEFVDRALSLYDGEAPRRLNAESLLVEVLLAMMSQDFSRHDALVGRLNEFMHQPTQRRAYLRVAATGYESTGKPLQAFDIYLELARLEDELAAARLPDANNELVPIDGALQVTASLWIGTRLRQLVGSSDATAQQAMRDRMVELLANYDVETLGVDPLRRKLRMLPAELIVPALWLDLATTYLEQGHLLPAEMTLIHLQRTAGPAAVSEAGQATAQLAKLYQSEQRTALAADQFRLLATRFAEIRVDGELTGRQVAEQMALAGTLPSTRSLSEWPHGQVRVNVKANPRRGSAYKLTVVSLRESVGNWGTDKLINYDANNQRIELLDEFGQPESSISLEKNALSGAVSFHAKSFGHLLVLSLADRIVAIDTLGDRSGGANTVLWEIPLEEAANSMQMRLQRVPKVVRNPWEWEDMLTTTTDGTLVGELGAVAARGICFQKQRMLMCVDPLTGEVLWNRRDVEAGSTLFGDDERLFLVEPRQNEARVFRMVDGVELESRSLPDERQRWAFRGGRVLTWDGEYYRRQPLRLKMVDVWTGQELWNFDVEGNAKGDLMGTDELGVLQPNGKFVVLNLEDGSAVIQTQVEPEPDLLHIQCLRSRDQYLLLTDRERKNQAGENVMTRASYPKQFGVDRFLTGNVYALDRTTGELSWSRPANIDGYYFPSKQPVGMPVLFFYRMRSERRPTSRGTTNHTDILVLDRRNGQLLLQDSQPKRFQRVDELKAEPADDSVVLQLYGDRRVEMKLTDLPRPPAPAYVDENLMTPPKERDGPLGTALDAIKIFGRALEKIAE